jgi:transcriptional regulator with XRE-family HTH domain
MGKRDTDSSAATANYVDRAIGNRVRILRESQNLSADVVAGALEISEDELVEIEQGGMRLRAAQLFKLSVFCEVPIGFFFETLKPQGGPIQS